MGTSYRVEIGDLLCQTCAPPASHSISLAAIWEGEKRGYSGGGLGLYIEANREAFDGRD
jgi:hypothetical protein